MKIYITRNTLESEILEDCLIIWSKKPKLGKDGVWGIGSSRDEPHPAEITDMADNEFKEAFGFTPKYGTIREYDLVENK